MDEIINHSFGDKPREGDNSDGPGNYQLILKASESIINPGGTLKIELYISGYGKIDNSKILFYPSNNLIDHRQSFVLDGINDDNGIMTFGRRKTMTSDYGITIDLHDGLIHPSWTEQKKTLFYDVRKTLTPQIATEIYIKHAPFEYHLSTHKTASPGDYSLYFTFTYFNGVEWKGDRLEMRFTLRNKFLRYENWITLLGFGFAIIATIAAIIDIVKAFL